MDSGGSTGAVDGWTRLKARGTEALRRLDGWLQTMRQPGGYGGPVVHWWRHSLMFAGPAVDWRYEGILAGYALLANGHEDQPLWNARMRAAMEDVRSQQRHDGAYRGSGFERNPGTHGTPHEAAASLGLLAAASVATDLSWPLGVAKANLDHLIDAYWDEAGQSFNDHRTVTGRVPNKLATMAEALLEYGRLAGSETYVDKARAALDTVLRYQVPDGPYAGAVHQYAPAAAAGDGRLFPYYNARCVVPLLKAAEFLGVKRYADAAGNIVEFLTRTVNPDGSWPQIVYGSGRRAEGPRWVAGAADILRCYYLYQRPAPAGALERFLGGQLESGAFPTAEGFGADATIADWHDFVPVAGWNDKAFRFLAEWAGDALGDGSAVQLGTVEREVLCDRTPCLWRETETEMRLETLAKRALWYHWKKAAPWAWAHSVRVAGG